MAKPNLRRSDWGRIALLLLLSFLYLSPGGSLLLEGRVDKVLSDGTDPAALPYSYSILLDHLRHHPSNLLFGAVPTDRLNPPEGFSIWFPWIEKFSVTIAAPFVALEQQSTFFVFVLFALNGIGFYSMARTRGWSQALSLALAICWAFSAYTRARAGVHMALAGVFMLPFVILGLDLAIRGQNRRSLLAAVAAFLVAATAAHYYLIILAFLSPFWSAYVAIHHQAKGDWKRLVARVLVAVLPAVLLVGWSYAQPIPSSWVKPNTITHIKTGETRDGGRHPFLITFASHPIDYFTGELGHFSLTGPVEHADFNPLRGALTEAVYAKKLEGSNPHERSNGVRWLIWLAVGAAIWLMFQEKGKQLWLPLERRQIWFFSVFALFCMWLSFEPDFLPIPGPSAWLAGLVSQFRVPSRAGIFANFGLLMVAGIFLHAWLDRQFTPAENAGLDKKTKAATVLLWPKLKSKLLMAGVLPALAIAELPPLLNGLPISNVQARRADLADGQACGYGLYYPYVSGTWALLEWYYFLQTMRGSKCKIINANSETVTDRNRRFMNSMPLHEKYLQFMQQNPAAAKSQLIHLAACLPMDWIVFDQRVPPDFARDVCSTLGFEQTSADTCRSKERERPVAQTAESCLR